MMKFLTRTRYFRRDRFRLRHTKDREESPAAGRLIRRADDRGVVAVLDPRLVTARYGNFLRASMPPFWTTTDREMAVGALRRLGE